MLTYKEAEARMNKYKIHLKDLIGVFQKYRTVKATQSLGRSATPDMQVSQPVAVILYENKLLEVKVSQVELFENEVME